MGLAEMEADDMEEQETQDTEGEGDESGERDS
jgi:hypothetical protein